MASAWHYVGVVSTDRVGGLLEDGDIFRCGGTPWEVLQTPGHSDGLICLYQRESGTFISSDLLLPDINYSPILESPPRDGGNRPNYLIAYLESLERIERMEINVVLPGHGQPAHNHRALIARQRAHCEKRRRQILGALDNEKKTAYQIWETLYPTLHPIDLFLGISNIVSYLDVLQKEGKATGREVNGLDYYSRSQ
jgi:glyoxylase-like metal-dependent hydrolase (beta-lactamase superfamily II)